MLRIAPGMPSAVAVRANAQALGRYAAACQEAGLVPVVEPEVRMGGPSTLGHCETVTSMVLLEVMSELHDYGVDFEGVVLKPNMTLPGGESGEHPTPAEVAEATLGTLNGVPATLAGVAFAASGQRPERATENLAAMQHIPHLWPLTFAFGGALTGPALAAWRGEPSRWEAGQRALAHRVAMNTAALSGHYSPELELDPVRSSERSPAPGWQGPTRKRVGTYARLPGPRRKRGTRFRWVGVENAASRDAGGDQTLKPRARSCSRPSSVILSGPQGGIHTQLIRKSGTRPSSAAAAWSSITSVSGQAALVRVMSMVAAPSSPMATP